MNILINNLNLGFNKWEFIWSSIVNKNTLMQQILLHQDSGKLRVQQGWMSKLLCSNDFYKIKSVS